MCNNCVTAKTQNRLVQNHCMFPPDLSHRIFPQLVPGMGWKMPDAVQRRPGSMKRTMMWNWCQSIPCIVLTQIYSISDFMHCFSVGHRRKTGSVCHRNVPCNPHNNGISWGHAVHVSPFCIPCQRPCCDVTTITSQLLDMYMYTYKQTAFRCHVCFTRSNTSLLWLHGRECCAHVLCFSSLPTYLHHWTFVWKISSKQ